jgi:hypothetical protein
MSWGIAKVKGNDREKYRLSGFIRDVSAYK